MYKLMLVPIVALLTTTACAADLSGDDDGAIASPDKTAKNASSNKASIFARSGTADNTLGARHIRRINKNKKE